MNKNTRQSRNLFIHIILTTKSAVKGLQSRKLYAALFVLIITVGAFSLSAAISSLTDYVIIRSSGRTGPVANVTANSGSAKDIQAAVDEVATVGGGVVHIPQGEFDFVNVGEPWETVNIPAGVNLFGAPTERTKGLPVSDQGMNPNDQVVEWKTVLKMPWDVTSDIDNPPKWFSVTGDFSPDQPTRISDIKLVGYRSIDPSSTTVHTAIDMSYVKNFRIDHCCFEHTTAGISLWGCCGVIDHCRIYNIYGYDDLSQYHNSDVGYGVQIHRDWTVNFEPTMLVLGQYTSYTVFIEDCYFSKWRHCVASGHGAHYVFRYNTIDQDLGHFSLDAHGLRDTQEGHGGTRCAEFYENKLTNAVVGDLDLVLQNGGGCGVWFNNYVDSSYATGGMTLYPEDYIPSETWHLKDFYLWSGLGGWNPGWDGIPNGFTADRNVLADWSRTAYNAGDSNYPNVNPSWSIAGYQPYPYPHTLATE